MKNIKSGIAAPSFSAVGPIWLGCWLKQKTIQKAYAAMSFLLFNAGGEDYNQFILDIKFAFVGVQKKKVASFYLVAVHSEAIGASVRILKLHMVWLWCPHQNLTALANRVVEPALACKKKLNGLCKTQK